MQLAEGASVPIQAVNRGNPWRERLSRTGRGDIKADVSNLVMILDNDPAWAGVLGYCTFSYRIMKCQPPPFDSQAVVGEWEDSDAVRLRVWMERHYRFMPSTADAHDAVTMCAEANPFHPVRNYLNALEWDGVLRLDNWLSTYTGAPVSLYSSLVGRMFLIGAIARVMCPPVKMDNVIIFEGKQGLGKSGVFGILAGEWFSDVPINLGEKEGLQQLRGLWIIELAELDSLSRSSVTRAKQFFACSVDRYRPSYGRLSKNFVRQCVFSGTTNLREYLQDATGNRRFWPIPCSFVDSANLARDRDQLWAEAMMCFKRGDQWWPEARHHALFESEQMVRCETDAWEDLIESWLLSRVTPRVMMYDIMHDALKLEASHMRPAEQKRVGLIMAKLGWRKVRARVAGGRATGYERIQEGDRE